jgi:hypothetical protein
MKDPFEKKAAVRLKAIDWLLVWSVLEDSHSYAHRTAKETLDIKDIQRGIKDAVGMHFHLLPAAIHAVEEGKDEHQN